MHFLSEYGLFLAKALTLVITILMVVLGVIVITTRNRDQSKEYLDVKKLNDRYLLDLPKEEEDDDLTIIDTYLGNERRSIKTLSYNEQSSTIPKSLNSLFLW